MVGPRGKTHGTLAKGSFAEGRDQTPGGQTPGTVASGAGIQEGLFLLFQTNFGEALSPSFDPGLNI
jgi:hypothetical protein